jgi:multidrug efflux system membrane fusion protein
MSSSVNQAKLEGRRPWVALAGIMAMAAAVGCGDKSPPPTLPVPVAVATVQRQAVPVELAATGTVEPLQTVSVESQVGGILTRVAFEEGDEVKRGQVLFQIDPRSYQAALQQAEAMLAKDRAQLANADEDVRRYESLAQKEYVTSQQYAQVKTTAQSLRATVEADQAAVENARLNLQFATVRSPINGRAGGLLLRPGNLVRPNGSAPLVVINQIHPILVRFAVPATDLPEIQQRRRQGAPLPVLTDAAQGRGSSQGELSFIDNAVDTTTGTIMLKARFANQENTLWPGEFVRVRLRLRVDSAALVLPAPAVVSGQQGTYVFVVTSEGTAATRPVKVDRMGDSLAVIAEGVAPGDRVVTDGQLRLRNGSKVQIKAGA